MTTATTTTAIHPLMKDQDVTPEQELTGLNDLRNYLQYGDFVSAPMVTDTAVYEVLMVTKRTV